MKISASIPRFGRTSLAPLRAEDYVTSNAKQMHTSTRIAYLVSRYPAVSHTFILNEVRALKAKGFEIDVASVNPPDRGEDAMTTFEIEAAKNTYYIKQQGVTGALKAHAHGLNSPLSYFRGLMYALSLGGWNIKRVIFGFFYFTEALMVAQWMKSAGHSHLHVHFATAAANIGLILRKFHSCTLSFTVHGPDEFYDAPGQWLEEKIAAVDFLICIGRFARSQIMKLSSGSLWSKFEICPLGVDPEFFVPAQKKLEECPFNILCVGRLTPAKGQRILLDACRILNEDGRRFSLVIVGAGPDDTHLRQAAEDFGIQHLVEFRGALNQNEVKACYADADAFALPSFAEGIPVVLMEAMASGVPCVTTRITGIPELIQDGVDGLLVTPSDATELADALSYLMDDPELRQELAKQGRMKVMQAFDIRKNIDRLASVFHRRLGVS